jgi:glycosyltransferase involved in cell wall biosynthesis
MRLLFLDQFSDPGGAQQVLLELLPGIRARGWEATVAMPGNGVMFDRVQRLGFKSARIACGPYRSGRKTILDMGRFALSTPLLVSQIRGLAAADLIYVNGPRLLPAVAMARPTAPVVFHAHSSLPPGPERRLAGRALRSIGAHVIANCEFVAQCWREMGLPVAVIYNGVAGPQRLLSGGDAIGCIGRIAPEKRQMEFVEAARSIHAKLPRVRFAIYGAPLLANASYDWEVRNAAQDLPVDFAGWVDDVPQALSRLALLLVPCGPHEATTRVILEAFACGVPVIAYRSGGIPEIIDDRRNGYLVSSAAEMAQAAIDLLTGPGDRLAAISAAARDTWSRRFTLERFQRDVLALLEPIGRPSNH